MGPGMSFVVATQQHYQRLKAVAQPLFQKPARNLTLNEAWLLIEYHVMNGDMKLVGDFPEGNPGRVMVNTLMAQVQYMQQNDAGHRFNWGTGTPVKALSFNPTPQFAIVLYRFAVWLKNRWAASEIVWGGVGGAQDSGNCHTRGHCVDFFGAKTGRGGVFDVAKDWSSQPVYTKDGKIHSREGTTDAWGNDSKPYYRFSPTLNIPIKDPSDKSYWNPLAADFFLDVMEFVAAECNNAGDSSPAEMRGGSPIKWGVTKHPDYPSIAKREGRRDHWDHVHFQLGNAF